MIELGDQLPGLTLAIRDADGSPRDGGAVSLSITLPDNTVASVTPVRSDVGMWSATYTAVQVGLHTIEWTVTGAYAGTQRDTQYVEQQISIVSLDEIKAHLGIRRSSEDETLRLMALIASDACESAEGTNRRWRRRIITAEKHDHAPVFQLFNAPVISVTSLTAGGSVLTSDAYDIDLATGLVYDVSGDLSSGARRFGISVTYVTGSTAVPALVRNGVLEMVRHLYSAHQGGSSLPTQAEPDYTTSLAYLIPNRVAYAWQAYRMPG